MTTNDAPSEDRSNWPVRIHALGQETCDGEETTAEQRLSMMWELVTQAWGIAGKAIPTYSREETPVRFGRMDEMEHHQSPRASGTQSGAVDPQ